MSHARHDIFAMVVNFINDVWEPIHVSMGIFEMHNTFNANHGSSHIKVLLNSFDFLNKVISYVI